VIHLTLRDLRHDLLTFTFSVLGLGVLIFSFLLSIPLSLAITRFGEAGGMPQNVIIVERDVLQPEQSRIAPGLAQSVSAILGDRLNRVDPVIFRILRVEEHPIQLRGVALESWVTTFRLQLVDGAWPSRSSEVVIGQLAAQEGGWRTGSEISIYGQPFRVAGIAEGPGIKTQTVWMSYLAASALFGPEKDPQLLVAHLQTSADPLASRQDLENGLQSIGSGYDAYFEDALLREYGAALNDLRSLSLLTAVIAIASVTLGSNNLAWLAAEERKRLLGVLRTVGFDRRAVGGYLLLRAAAISVASYLLALAAAIVFIRVGIGPSSLNIAGTQTALTLSPATAVLGLLLACAASLTGTWLSARNVLSASPASLLGRGPGSSFA
jgi:ABC-type antimicrobial peptide transport system permease subunit